MTKPKQAPIDNATADFHGSERSVSRSSAGITKAVTVEAPAAGVHPSSSIIWYTVFT
jgi:hypothetical protein